MESLISMVSGSGEVGRAVLIRSKRSRVPRDLVVRRLAVDGMGECLTPAGAGVDGGSSEPRALEGLVGDEVCIWLRDRRLLHL